MIYSQNWYPVVVNDELSISFPGLTAGRFIEDNELYLYKSTEYALMVGITKELALESNEHERIKLNSSDSSIDRYFSDLINGKLKQNESRLDS